MMLLICSVLYVFYWVSKQHEVLRLFAVTYLFFFQLRTGFLQEDSTEQ